MIKTEPAEETREKERLVVVAGADGGDAVADDLRRRYPEWRIVPCAGYLAGIAEVARGSVRGVVACADASLAQLDNAIAGLRRAVGPGARFVLYCRPEAEPVARGAVRSGADGYLIYPFEGDELDAALGCARIDRTRVSAVTATPTASMEELAQLGDVLAIIGARPMALVEKLALIIRAALDARGVTVIVQGAVATSGDVVTKPVLSAPLTDDDGVIGQLTVGERRDGAYTPAHMEKLTRYAAIASRMLRAASGLHRWRRLAETDECSGLPNRRHLHARLDDIVSRAQAERFPVTVLLFDIDDFKAYNDTYGHDAGDEIIRVIGRLFRENCRDQDVVARYGGDEFAVVFWDPEGPRTSGSSHPECALVVLDRFRAALKSQQFSKAGSSATGRVTISGGLATYPWDSTTRDALIRRADQALLSAKRAGKNRIFHIGEGDPENQG